MACMVLKIYYFFYLYFFIFIFKRKEINQFNFFIISILIIIGIIFSFTCGGLLTLGFFEHNTGLGDLDATHSLTQRSK